MAELKRLGRGCDMKVVSGCLASLVSQGLVKEPSRGMFTKVKIGGGVASSGEEPKMRLVKDKPAPTVGNAGESTEGSVPPSRDKEKSPLEIMTSIAFKVSELKKSPAFVLCDSIDFVVKEIESAALEIAQMFDDSESRTKKLKQLQSLLKDLD